MIRKLSALSLLYALVLTGCATGAPAPVVTIVTTPATVSVAPSTAIQHVVVIFGENISFDHYFGTYPNAANTSGTTFTAASGTPVPNNYISNPTLLTANPNLTSANGTSAANPFRLGTGQAATGDQNHNYGPNRPPLTTARWTCSPPRSASPTTPRWSMRPPLPPSPGPPPSIWATTTATPSPRCGTTRSTMR